MRMKSIHLFCASPASTAICSIMDHHPIHRPGLRPLADRPTHRLRPKYETPCLAQLPFDPSGPFYHNKSRKSTSSATKQAIIDHQALRRKTSADVDDLASPLRSSTYLLSNKPYVDFILSDSERALVPSEPIRDRNNNNNYDRKNYKRLDTDGFRASRPLSTSSYESPAYKPLFAKDSGAKKDLPVKLSDHLMSLHKSSPAPSNHQVVELRVSIHCKGCEGKLRKHISRMEGVTSFSIDLATKKVTVIGDLTPLSVLASIFRVKNAQFWPSQSPSPASSSSSSSTSSNSSSPSPRLSLAR